jgi:hypothetical protein
MSEGRLRLPAMTVALLFLFLAVVALVTLLADPYQMDFVSYWAAGRLALEGNAAGAYDAAVHNAMELQAIPLHGRLPFAYPPCFLLLAAPFAWLDYPPAGFDWVLLGFAAYCAALRGWAPDRPWLALSFPPLLVNAITGQAGFLATALLLGGTALLPKRPLWAGALLGLLVLKPQLALVAPLALVSGREWRALAAAAAAAAALVAASLIAFGWAPWQAWLGQAGLAVSIASQGLAGWHRMASVYGALRLAGLPEAAAWAAHALVGLAALAGACLVWRRRTDPGLRGAALAAATALASPYFFVYDTLILVLPFLWLVGRGRHWALLGAAWAILFVGLAQAAGWDIGVNLIPLAALILLALVLWEAGQPRGFSASASETAPLPRAAALG